jgi:hypothetical protein
MALIRQQVFNVIPTGVGRKDYSQQVEYSVEPIVRSYQESYVLDEVYNVGAGLTRTIDVTIPLDSVVLLYDFIASQTGGTLLNFQVFAVDSAGVASSIFSKYGFQRVEHHHSRGAPVFQQIRIALTNFALVGVSVYVTIAGIVVGSREYYQRLAP